MKGLVEKEFSENFYSFIQFLYGGTHAVWDTLVYVTGIFF